MARRRYRYQEDFSPWPNYVSVAERRVQAARVVEDLRETGRNIAPVGIEGRTIAKTFWGKAWCDNLARYHDYANRIERGRSYVRNGAVVDLQIECGRVSALVSGSVLYNVSVAIAGVPARHWAAICGDCAGRIDSLVELLQGRFAEGVMARICREGDGLFPHPREIRFSCTCPDAARMCKHVAATMLGVGARLDAEPELLFRLRGVGPQDLVAGIDASARRVTAAPTAGRVLESADLSALFGLELESGGAAGQKPAAPTPVRGPAKGVGRRAKGPAAAARPQGSEVKAKPRAAGKARSRALG
jgi:uncharacterized Zn finger protein